MERTRDPLFLLVDNGSVRPASTLALRETASLVARMSGAEVLPVSLAHSDRVPSRDLGGDPALTLPSFLRSGRIEPGRPVVILPFFLGNRGAIVRMVEKSIREAQCSCPGLCVRLARFLFEEDGPGQEILALAAASRVRECISADGAEMPVVVLADHGSPVPVAAQVRNFVAGQVQALLRDEVRCVIPASMERREGERYAFADPLLEDVLRRPSVRSFPVVLAMFFLLPGRHAGEGGDVAEIRDAAVAETGNANVRTTALLGSHPLIVRALADRVESERDRTGGI